MLDGDPHRAAARARLARGGRDGRRRDVLLLARATSTGPPGATVSTTERLSSEGWQSCSSCHFEGLTDSVVWQFGTGPRKSVPLNATFNPSNPNEQRVLNYSAIFDEVEDFEANIRNVSGPGRARRAAAVQRAAAGDEHVRPQPRPAVRRQRRHQPRAVRGERVREGERRPSAAHGHAAGQQHRGAGADRAARVGEAARCARRRARSRAAGVGNRLSLEAGQPGPHAVHAGRLHRLPRRRQVDDQHQGLHLAAGRRPRSSPRRRRRADVRRADRRAVPEPLPARHRLVQPRRARAGPTRSAPTSAASRRHRRR